MPHSYMVQNGWIVMERTRPHEILRKIKNWKSQVKVIIIYQISKKVGIVASLRAFEICVRGHLRSVETAEFDLIRIRVPIRLPL